MPRRTKENYAVGLAEAIKPGVKSYQGIKGSTLLNSLKFYSVSNSIQIDLMHTVGYGVIKELFYYWFDAKLGPYTLRHSYDQIEKRYMSIRPPAYLQTAPRSITEFNIWKAKEFINFLLFYSLPVFQNLMENEHYEHLTKLVVALEILLAKKIYRNQLPIADQLLREFVRDASRLYSPKIMKSGFHELLHLVECTEEIGPLVCFSAFPFEELNRKFLKFIKGRDLMGEEFYKLFCVIQELISFVEKHNFENLCLKNYIVKNTEIKSSNRKRRNSSEISFKLKGIFNCDNEELIKFTKLNGSFGAFYKDLNCKGIAYSKFHEKSKFDNSCISFENYFGLIAAFVLKDGEPYVICKYIYDVNSFFFVPSYPENKHSSVCCHISRDDFFIAPAKKIKKVFLIKIDTNRTFINFFRSSHFFT